MGPASCQSLRPGRPKMPPSRVLRPPAHHRRGRLQPSPEGDPSRCGAANPRHLHLPRPTTTFRHPISPSNRPLRVAPLPAGLPLTSRPAPPLRQEVQREFLLLWKGMSRDTSPCRRTLRSFQPASALGPTVELVPGCPRAARSAKRSSWPGGKWQCVGAPSSLASSSISEQ